MSDYNDGIDKGAIVTIKALIKAVDECDYTVDNIKTLLRSMLDNMNEEKEDE